MTALMTVFSLAACGGENKGDGPASLNGGNKAGEQQAAGDDVPKDPKEAIQKWAKCMRDNGIDMPEQSGDGMIALPGIRADDKEAMDKHEKANAACKKYMPKSEYNPDDPAEKDKRAKINQCLREKGVDVPDEGSGKAMTFDFGDEKLMKAYKDCTGKDMGQVAPRGGQ